MAVEWEFKFTVTDRATKRIRVTGTPSDGRGPYSCDSQIDSDDLAKSKADVIDALWAQYRADVTNEQGDEELLAGWETDIKAALDGKKI